MKGLSTSSVVVVGRRKFGESDLVVELLSDEGTQAVFAPGARNSRRRFPGGIELFTSADVELQQWNGRMAMLKSWTVRARRLGLRSGLDRIGTATFVTELVRLATPGATGSAEVLALLEAALDALAEGQPGLSVAIGVEFGLLRALGLCPELARCVQCGGQTDRMALDLRRGGAFCLEHTRSEACFSTALLAQLSSGEGVDLSWQADAMGPTLEAEAYQFLSAQLGRSCASRSMFRVGDGAPVRSAAASRGRPRTSALPVARL